MKFEFQKPNPAIGLLAITLALPLAYFIYSINERFSDNPELAVKIIGISFIILFIFPSTIYLLKRRKASNPWRLSIIVIGIASVLLVSVYLFWVSSFVSFPADILIWSESDFVNDILKFRVGYPLYTAQVNNESFTYTPGTQMLTYFLARLLGNETSIPLYRTIQITYTLLSAFVAFLCCRRLTELSSTSQRIHEVRLWDVILMPILFLIATNSLTNPFVHNLHNDSLAQLVSVVAYWLLLKYVSTHDKRVLILMSIIPAVGFLVKQSLIIWAVFYCVQLAIFDRPRSMKRLLIFTLATFGGIGIVVAWGYLLWGNHFIYWIFIVLGKHGVSLLRAFQHLLDAWLYVAIGLIGGIVLLRDENFSLLLGPWLIWLALIILETYTSGVAWMINHIGPGSLIAGCWFLAALARVWPLGFQFKERTFLIRDWISSAMAVALIMLLFGGLGIVRIPIKPLSDDAYRYIKEIEKVFKGQSAKDILLDMGTWVYLPDRVIMKDRVPSIGERGYSESGDFSGILSRIEQKRYSKILVRNLYSEDFFYDYGLWRKSSGIRKALLKSYHEVGRIKAVSAENYQYSNYFLDEISILIPISN